MSYMDRENILTEGLIDKLIGLLTKKKKLKGLSREERKAYDDAMKHFNKARAILKKSHEKSGIKSKFI